MSRNSPQTRSVMTRIGRRNWRVRLPQVCLLARERGDVDEIYGFLNRQA